MATWSPLTTNFAVNLQDSSSRGGVRPNAVQNHHTATNNKAVALSLFAPGGRTVTPNYFVAGKEIWGIVPEDRRAWTSGSAFDDTRAVTIETLNSTNAPNWQFAADTMATLILLNADIARRYGIPFRHAINGIYEHKNLYQWYRRSYATACAGPSFNINHVISAASKAGSSIPGKGPKVIHYATQDAGARGGGRTLNPGGSLYLHKSKGVANSKASNVVGGIGPYSITPHIYAEGAPGDGVDVQLIWQNTRARPITNSGHYVERLTLDKEGKLRASREFKRAVQRGYAVYVKVTALSTNKSPVKITMLDCDSYLFV